MNNITHKVYQNIEIDGKDVGFTKTKKGSEFCNEGKWKNFIEPFLPEDCKDMTFVEFGCNAGIFPSLAEKRGFYRVLGIDKSRSAIKQGNKYKDEIGGSYTLINNAINEHFDIDALPVCDYLLMSNFHYYLPLRDLILLLHKLEYKARNIIIVSAEDAASGNGLTRAKGARKKVKKYLKNWKETGYIPQIKAEDDTFPRQMWSACYQSPYLRRVSMEKMWREWDKGFSTVTVDFVKAVLKDENVDFTKLEIFEAVKFCSGKNDHRASQYIEYHKQTVLNVRDNGQKSPVLITKGKRMVDGSHRAITLMELGHSSILSFYK